MNNTLQIGLRPAFPESSVQSGIVLCNHEQYGFRELRPDFRQEDSLVKQRQRHFPSQRECLSIKRINNGYLIPGNLRRGR